ncbi:MAG: hypothetical protein HUU55_19985 [Myxococcales bacterium]|nr:hypothetical protein [Myxococcales bacterium]
MTSRTLVDIEPVKLPTLFLISFCIATVSCGPTATIRPLHGESELVHKLIGFPKHSMDGDAVTEAANDLVLVTRAKNYLGIWQKLTSSFRQEVLVSAGMNDAAGAELPVTASLEKVDAMASGSGLLNYIFGGVPVAFSTNPPNTAESVTSESPTNQFVIIYALFADGSVEPLRFAFSGTAWQFDGRRPLK